MMQAPSMLRSSGFTDSASATLAYTGVMSATTARGSPCSSRRRTHRILAGDDPDPMINAAGTPSTVRWHAASRSGFKCLVPLASEKIVPVYRREQPHTAVTDRSGTKRRAWHRLARRGIRRRREPRQKQPERALRR